MEEITEILERNSGEIAREPNGQLKKGVVLNPLGRPKGSLDFKTKWERMVEKVAMQNNLTPDEIDEQLLLVGYKRAKDGDYSFYRDAMDRIHGKPMQYTDVTTNGKDLPQPILGNVLNNNSNTTNIETQQED